jgi:Predicted 3-hydroxylacyl-(acyl carrier protein) dehydratase
MTAHYDIEDLIPHKKAMCLIKRVLDWGEDWCQVEVDVADSGAFIIDGHVPAYVTIEYMAQTVAALAGLRAKARDKPIQLGLLLGTRLLASPVEKIKADSTLTVWVKEIFSEENGLAVYDCQVTGDGVDIKSNLNVYQSDKIGELFSD